MSATNIIEGDDNGVQQPQAQPQAQAQSQTQTKQPAKQYKKRQENTGGLGLFMKNVITKKVVLPFTSVGLNIRQLLEEQLKTNLEGKCIEEGFIQKKSVRILNYSSGVVNGNNVLFDVVVECYVCNPVEGHKFKARVLNVTKAGLRCDANMDESPVDVFVARDHNFNNTYFNGIQKDDIIDVRIIAQRYEMNDPRISVIAEVMQPKKPRVARATTKSKKQPRLVLEG